MRSIIPLVGLAAISIVVSYTLTISTGNTVLQTSYRAPVPAAPVATSGITLSTSSKYLADTLFAPGDVITYSIVVSNSGVDKAYAVSVLDPLPPDLVLVPLGLTATQGSVAYSGTVVNWNGALLPGIAALITVPVTVSTCQWPVTNSATISSPVVAQPVTVQVGPIEGFEGTTSIYTPSYPPPAWSTDPVTGSTATWSLAISGTLDHPSAPVFDGSSVASFNSYAATAGDSSRLATRVLNFPADYTPRLTFWMYHDSDASGANTHADQVQVQLSTNGGAYENVGAPFARYDGTPSNHWSMHTVDPPGHSGNNVRIGLLGISDFGNNIYIDDIGLQYIPISGSINVQSAVALVNEPITLTGTTAGSTDSYTKTWDFGDGAGLLAGKIVSHTYTTIGSYVVSMAVCGLNVTRTVHASGSPVGLDLALVVSSPALMQKPVYFTPTVTSAALPVTSTWNFGDGITATNLVVSHTYVTPHLYTATLTVSNSLGAVVTTTTINVLPVADLSIMQQAGPLPAAVAHDLTYTVVISNAGPADAANVWFTDTLPANSNVTIRSRGIVGAGPGPVVCSVVNNVTACPLGTLTVGKLITITLVVNTGTSLTVTNLVAVRADAVDLNPATNVSNLAVYVNPAHLYFPTVLNHYPPIPDAPVLNPIDDPHANGTYMATWNAVLLADFYTLQESSTPAFTDAITVYSSTGTSWSTQNRPAGTYYYRVRAANSTESSAWSNVQSVSFTLQYDGVWSGRTTQNRIIAVTVTQNRVERVIFNFYNAGCIYNIDRQYFPAIYLDGNSFTLTGSGATLTYSVTGTFTSATNAVGSVSMTSFDVTSIPQCIGTSTATWVAAK